MRFVIAFSALSPKAKITLHSADCRNATPRPGRVIDTLPADASFAVALAELELAADDSGREYTVCRCAAEAR
jgi:hypothetical protein